MMAFKYISVPTLYSLILLMVIGSSIILREMQAIQRTAPTFVSRMFMYIGMVVYLPIVILIPLIHWPEICGKINYINQWNCFEVRYEYIT